MLRTAYRTGGYDLAASEVVSHYSNTAGVGGGGGAPGPLYDFRLLPTLAALGFARTGTGSFIDSSGNIALTTETAPSSGIWLPRIQHNSTAPHVPLGVLIEPQATNLASTTFTNWTTFRAAAPTEGVDGFWSFVANGTSPDFGAFRQNAPLWSASTVYCFSGELIPVAGRTYRVSYVDNSVGFAGGFAEFTFATPSSVPTITNNSGATGYAALTERGAWLIWITFTTIAVPTYHYYEFKCVSHFGSGELMKLKLPQLETGLVPTSRIPNSTAGSLVRSADPIWDLTGPAFMNLWGTETLGPELVTNGTFDTNLTGWTVSATATASVPVWASGRIKLVSDGSGFSIADQQLTTVAGKQYKLSLFLTYPGTGTVDYRIGTTQGGGEIIGISSVSAGGTTTISFVATGTASWIRVRTGSLEATGYLLDNISVKEVTSERTIIVEWYDTGAAAYDVFVAHSAGSIAESAGIYVSGGNIKYRARAGGVDQIDLTIGTIAANGRNKCAFRFGSGAFGGSRNGAAEVTGTGTIPAPTHGRISGASLYAGAAQDILAELSFRPAAITGAANSALSAL
jgi:hypothetical protein